MFETVSLCSNKLFNYKRDIIKVHVALYLDGEDCPDPVRGRGTRRGFCRHLPAVKLEEINIYFDLTTANSCVILIRVWSFLVKEETKEEKGEEETTEVFEQVKLANL